jgi:hypothetical protein
VVAKNFVLSPLMPFKGGVVNLALSLHAVEGQNQLRSFLKTMGEFAKLLVVPQLSAAIELAGPLSAGLQGLFGQTNGAAHLVYANTFVGKSSTSADAKNYLRSGYVAVLRAPEPGLDRGQLLVVNNELRVGASLGNNAAFDGCDYLLLRVEVREDRDDFNELPGIKSAMDRALEAIVAAEDAKADAFYRVAVTAALQAPELTRADRRRVIELLKRDFEEAKGGFRPTGLVGGHGMDLQARWAQQGMTVDEALARGEPTLEEALAP